MTDDIRTVRDHDALRDLERIDNDGKELTPWEIEFVDSMLYRVLRGHVVTPKERLKINQMLEERVDG